MRIVDTDLDEVKIIEPSVFTDNRGFFFESYNHRKFEEGIGGSVQFVQDNHSRSERGVLRGLHYQLPPHGQAKLVRAVYGEIYDVAVDVRQGSSTFGKWTGVVLSAQNKRQLWIPEGFAHGFLVLSDFAECLYKTSSYWNKDAERCIAWNDPGIQIDWPFQGVPILSDKDGEGAQLLEAECWP